MRTGNATRSNGQLRAISLFTGAGGLDVGFEAAGFRVLAAIEKDADARATILANRPNCNLQDEPDIFKCTPKALLKSAGLKRREVDLVFGGPPCQPFSKSAYWRSGKTKQLRDPRAKTLSAMFLIVEEALPKALVIENVRGIAYSGMDQGLNYLRKQLKRINENNGTEYHPYAVHLNAANFGVPQVRERTFVVAFRDGSKFTAPTSTHSTETDQTNEKLPKAITAWDAIGGLTLESAELQELELKGKWAGLLPSIPDGQNYLFHTSRGGGLPLFGWRCRYWSFLLKLAKNKPSWTIQASPGPATGPFHWDNRRLSVREMARLQTFPNDYEITGEYASARRQIGNAVPPALAEAVARRVRSVLLAEPYSSALTLSISARADRTRARRRAQVPATFLALAGDHKEHPGRGKGPGARKRKKKPHKKSSVAARPKRRNKRSNAKSFNIGGEQFATA